MRPARPPRPAGEALGGRGSVLRGVLTGAAPALVVLTALATGVAEFGAATGWRLLASPTASRLVLAVLVLVVVAGGVMAGGAAAGGAAAGGAAAGRVPLGRGPRTSATDGGDGRRTSWWLASAPGLLMFAYAVVSLVLPFWRRTGWFLGGDHVRHFTYTVQEAVTGNLDYTGNPYPRAWHTLAALVWTASGGRQDAAGLVGLVTVMSLGIWCAYALLAITTGHAARDLAMRWGLSEKATAGAGLVAGALTLWPSFLSQYMVFGFENSVVAALVLAVCARQVLAEPRAWRVVVCAAGVAVMANAWQVLLPATVLAFVVVSFGAARRGGLGAWLTVPAALAAAVAIALPGLRSVNTIGVGHATDAGVEVPLPVVFLPLAFAATLWVGWRLRRDLRVLAVVLMTLGTAITAPALAVRVGIPVTQYYPAKVLWNAVVLGLAPLGVVSAVAARSAWRVRGRRSVAARAVAATAATLVLGACAFNPVFAVINWPMIDGKRVLETITSPSAGQAQVVWLPGHLDDATIARILLDFYTVGSAPFTSQDILKVPEECDILAAQRDPAVLSSASPEQVAARYACVPGVRTIPVRPNQP